jgi:hypothetical protein
MLNDTQSKAVPRYRLSPHSKIWNFLNLLGEITVTRYEING